MGIEARLKALEKKLPKPRKKLLVAPVNASESELRKLRKENPNCKLLITVPIGIEKI